MAPRPPRVLVLGGTGMLGSVLWSRLAAIPGWRVRRSQRRDRGAPGWFDALDRSSRLENLLNDGGGTDYVLNALGLTKPEIREGDPASASAAAAVNSELPFRLSAAAATVGARVIHISTDAVFSGRHGPYDESAAVDPEDLYGRTKAAGEVRAPHFLTVRCSIIGPDPDRRRGLFEWFRALGPGGRATGFTDQLWNGVTTLQFARLCEAIIRDSAFDRIAAPSSLRHFCPNSPVSKYELLRLFDASLGLGAAVTPAASGRRVDRRLSSRWTDLTDLIGGPCDMAEAVAEMVRSKETSCPRSPS